MVVETLKNIAALKSHPIPSPTITDYVIYVEGYYEQGDGGGSMFWYNHSLDVPEDFGIHFIPKDLPAGETGRWVRQYDGYINAMFFGISKTPIDSAPPYNSARIQHAIDYIHRMRTEDISRGGLILFFPSGGYWINETIVLKSHVHLKGDTDTQFWVSSQMDYMFKLDIGQHENIIVENLYLDLGYLRSGKEAVFITGGFLFEATIDPHAGGTAGLSGGTFNNLKIKNAGGHGMFFKGGDNDGNYGLKFNQFIYCNDVVIERLTDEINCLRIIGYQPNLVFNYGGFGIPYKGLDQGDQPLMERGTNVFIDSYSDQVPEKSTMIIFNNVGIGAGPGKIPRFGVVMNHAENVNFDNCWFENDAIAVFARNSRAINIKNSRFADAAMGIYDVELAYMGDCIRVENSFVNVEGNYVTSSSYYYIIDTNRIPYFIRGIGDVENIENNVINVNSNAFQNIILSNTYGISQITKVKMVHKGLPAPFTDVISGIETEGKRVLVVKKGDFGTDIYRVNSMLNAGEILVIIAGDSDLYLHNWNSSSETLGRNISLGLASTSSLPLLQGQSASFMKYDGVNNAEKCVYVLLTIQ